MRLTIEDDKIVVDSITREEENELRKFAEDRISLNVVPAKFVKGEKLGPFREGSPSSTLSPSHYRAQSRES